MIKVGGKYKQEGKTKLFTYNHVTFDKYRWADAEKYLPEDFDLVHMKLSSGKIIPGWSNGRVWEGIRLKPEHEVKAWRRQFEENK